MFRLRRSIHSIRSSLSKSSSYTYTVALMGDGGVGKSSIISRFFHNTFSANYTPTVEEFYREKVEVDGRGIELKLLDTAGSYAFPAMQEIYFRKADVFVLVFAVDDKDSFEKVMELRSQILTQRGLSIPIVIVGNKCDTRSEEESSDAALLDLTIACDLGNNYVECSALEDTNLDRIFLECVKALHSCGYELPSEPKVLTTEKDKNKSLDSLDKTVTRRVPLKKRFAKRRGRNFGCLVS